jgi:hypothetical protein
MSDWKTGTVARATVRGVRDLLVMRTSGTRGGDDIWLTALHVGGWRSHTHADVTDVRPLVVLDPDEIATPEENAGLPAGPEIAKCLRKLAEADARSSWRARVAVRIADQIEAQTQPPRIPEPGVYAIVRASGCGLTECEWVNEGTFWTSLGGDPRPHTTVWANLKDPVLVREGVA